MSISITASTILTEWDQYYVDSGQGADNLVEILQQGSVYRDLARPIIHDDDIYQASEAEIGEVLQGFHATFSHKGNTTFTPALHIMRQMKIDQLILPDQIASSYLGFLKSMDTAARDEWPIVRYIWDVLIAKRAIRDAELEYYYKGGYVAAPGGGVPNVARQVGDGIRTIAAAAVTAGDATEVSLGTDNPEVATETFNAVETFVSGLPDHWHGQDVIILASPTTRLNYFRDRRNEHGADNNYVGEGGATQGTMLADGTTFRIVSLPGMQGHNDELLATPASNLLHIMRGNKMNFDMTKEDRQVKVFADWQEAVGFATTKMVYVAATGTYGSGST